MSEGVRVFERDGAELFITNDFGLFTARKNGRTVVGEYWQLHQVANPASGWREVTPVDITKLDTAGVFHESPPSEMTAGRVAYEARAKALSPLHLYQPWDKSDDAKSVAGRKAWEAAAQAAIEFNGDIANATIAELRARVAELENLLQRANDRAEFEYKCRVEAAVKKYEHYDNCKAELRRQLQAAWMRNDLTTADRIADLIGDKRPSEHESAEAGEVRA